MSKKVVVGRTGVTRGGTHFSDIFPHNFRALAIPRSARLFDLPESACLVAFGISSFIAASRCSAVENLQNVTLFTASCSTQPPYVRTTSTPGDVALKLSGHQLCVVMFRRCVKKQAASVCWAYASCLDLRSRPAVSYLPGFSCCRQGEIQSPCTRSHP